jgi:hypothetical protein
VDLVLKHDGKKAYMGVGGKCSYTRNFDIAGPSDHSERFPGSGIILGKAMLKRKIPMPRHGIEPMPSSILLTNL